MSAEKKSAGGTMASSSATYTPGPWRWDGHSLRPAFPAPGRSSVHTILSVDEMGVGFLGSDLDATRAEIEANHRLIAAAPTLFEDLLEARAALADAMAIVDDALRRVTAAGGSDA